MPQNKAQTLVAIGDTHHPFCNQEYLNKTYEIIEELHPRFVIQVGDLYDLYSFSRYARNQNYITPDEEIKCAKEHADRMWNTIRSIVPRGTKLVQLKGNHDLRISKQIIQYFPQISSLVEAAEHQMLWDFKGVEVVHEYDKEYWIDENTFAHHGDWLKTARVGARVADALYNVICGHSHVGGVSFLPRKDGVLYELNAGALPYTDVLPLRYTPLRLPKKFLAGCGVVDKYGPRFIPFI